MILIYYVMDHRGWSVIRRWSTIKDDSAMIMGWSKSSTFFGLYDSEDPSSMIMEIMCESRIIKHLISTIIIQLCFGMPMNGPSSNWGDLSDKLLEWLRSELPHYMVPAVGKPRKPGAGVPMKLRKQDFVVNRNHMIHRLSMKTHLKMDELINSSISNQVTSIDLVNVH